jgi:hypothetical protein
MHASVSRQRLFWGAVPITSRYYLQEYITLWKKGKLNSGKIWKIKWWQTFVRNVIIEINNVIMKIKWRGRGR